MDLFKKINPNFSLQNISDLHNPETYLLNPDIIGAINVAIATGQPLLLTGEPGTGKTQLAYKLAHELHKQENSFLERPLVFHTKTTSKAQELFYSYDALGHFQHTNIQKSVGKEGQSSLQYIKLEALGKAIALTDSGRFKYPELIGKGPNKNSVVLIDEIDKAPRDFPNDILNEIDKNQFQIKEAENLLIEKREGGKILVVMTSNSEKNLPEPFLRRCIYFHINFPTEEELIKIVKLRLEKGSKYSNKQLIQHFLKIRETVKKKKPATAELISWLKVLELANFVNGSVDLRKLSLKQKEVLMLSYSVIAKNKEDLELIKDKFLS